MTEKPILMNATMTRAILDGRKTQTRRVMKPQPWENGPQCLWEKRPGKSTTFVLSPHFHGTLLWTPFDQLRFEERIACDCPYGPLGTVLWVREAWGISDLFRKPGTLKWGEKEAWFYKGKYEPLVRSRVVYRADYSEGSWPGAWRPSIHMPREAARLFLRVTSIRTEWLRTITEEDAIAEGVEDSHDPIGAFVELWDEINKKRGFGWNINPRVWVISFEVIKDAPR